jgi:hypothetical protein
MPFVHLERELWDLRDATGKAADAAMYPSALARLCRSDSASLLQRVA